MVLFIFVIFFLNCFYYILGGNLLEKNSLVITSTTWMSGIHIVYRVNDTLNLTCTVTPPLLEEDVDYKMDWILPAKAGNSMHRMSKKSGENNLTLIISNLKEADSGEYKCVALENKTELTIEEAIVRINVKSRRKECADTMFQCSSGTCIMKRYTCDGRPDCRNGEDESESNCGPGDPCENKLRCEDQRCIPLSWCCDVHRDVNCTIRVKHICCHQADKSYPRIPKEDLRDIFEEETDLSYANRFNEMSFLQTTVYTVIGCAMAFMFIVTILVIAICRVQMKRTVLASPANLRPGVTDQYYPQSHNTNNHSGLACCDFDVYVNGTPNQDLISTNPLLVTYNINNGVQFVGKPINPPPYCEIVAAPPREGPPPPYASQENISSTDCGVNTQEDLTQTVEEEAEQTEDDALLGATCSSALEQQKLSVLSKFVNNDNFSKTNSAKHISSQNIGETSNSCSEGDKLVNINQDGGDVSLS